MKALLDIFLKVWAGRLWPLFLGTLLSVAVLSAGVALLGLSGWFITAAGAAGLAGAGLTFDVFRPSAGVRFLALGRAVARYGERLTTHDATLKGLATLRVKLLDAMLRRPVRELSRLRGSERLNHLTIDVDALDGLALRLVIPLLAAATVLAATFILLSWLTNTTIAGWQVASFVIGTLISAALTLRRTKRASRLGQRAMQALRMRFIDMMRGQEELAAAGKLDDWRNAVMRAHVTLQKTQADIDAADRTATFILSGMSTLAAAGALVFGTMAAGRGAFDAAHAALGFFAALAFFEAAMPLSRGIAELGKMMDAARRISTQLDTGGQVPTTAAEVQTPAAPDKLLTFSDVGISLGERVLFSGISFSLRAGETLALTGPSGSGKTTLLNLARGLAEPEHGAVLIEGTPAGRWPEDELAATVGYLPQRTALVAGTIAENLRLASTSATDAELLKALHIAALDAVILEKGGLEYRLGESGRGLSGGEKRRLALARLILTRPRILLLDEPTEGLDRRTSQTVLGRVRSALPDSAILVAAHREEERRWATRQIALK